MGEEKNIRWAPQETLALLNIRSEMDALFRDSTLKPPLWDQISRKLAELGYKRSGKKCKEKYENVYKYQKRTKQHKSNSNHIYSSSSKRKRKRSYKEMFERLSGELVRKQEEIYKKFVERMERSEKEREERWHLHEISTQHDFLLKQRSDAAQKDKALITFLQNFSNNQVQSQSQSQSQRWPKAEVEALINLRTTLEMNESNQKGPLWEEIGEGMRKMGYERSAKRCKEKWENINKYFKKVKDSNKVRSEDSKTCPYYHKLDALYRLKKSVPIMVRPESQWPLQIDQQDNSNSNSNSNSSTTQLDNDIDQQAESYGIVSNKHSSVEMEVQ